jgi:hypothetical protein
LLLRLGRRALSFGLPEAQIDCGVELHPLRMSLIAGPSNQHCLLRSEPNLHWKIYRLDIIEKNLDQLVVAFG